MSVNMHEIWRERTENLTIEVKDGKVAALDNSIEVGMASRVVKNGRLGFAFSTGEKTSEDELLKMAGAAAAYSEIDAELGFPASSALPEYGCDADSIRKTALEDKIAMAKELESVALKFDKRVKAVRKAVYEDNIKTVLVRNSEGVDIGYEKAVCAARVTVIAEENGSSEWDTELVFASSPDELNIKDLAETAAGRAVAYLGGRMIDSCRIPCVIDRHIVAELLELFSPMFFADSVHKKRSALSDKLGKRIYSDKVTIVNDPSKKDCAASTPCDGEGAPSRKTVLVSAGCVNAFLCDTYYSRKLKLPPTASSIRGAISQAPKIGVQNIYIEPGQNDLKTLLKEMGRGFHITEALGLHTANPITGDFSVGAAGLFVENGRALHGVKGVTIAGNINDLFGKIVSVANDLRFWYAKGGASLLVEEMAISGGQNDS